ncbi:MAG TPA: transposase [Dehalococcoidia bacterium]|nr:transposase [Dehalococcoidia bacterium]
MYMAAFKPRRSSPRLSAFSYEGLYAYMVTLNTHRRSPSLRSQDLIRECEEAIAAAAAQYRFTVLAYCFMPDHLHLLLQGAAGSKLIPFLQRFKQVTGYRFKAKRGRPLWQRSFYDHVLRTEEDIGDVAEYIWNNPVRAGLVADREAYPYWGPRGQT